MVKFVRIVCYGPLGRGERMHYLSGTRKNLSVKQCQYRIALSRFRVLRLRNFFFFFSTGYYHAKTTRRSVMRRTGQQQKCMYIRI